MRNVGRPFRAGALAGAEAPAYTYTTASHIVGIRHSANARRTLRSIAMTVQTFYRLAVWLPLAIPGLVAFLVHGLGIGVTDSSFDKVVQILLGSLLYGGVPYAPIALWATFWIDSRSEEEIRRRAVRSPLWMIVSFAAFCVLLGVRSANLTMAAALFGFGAIMILAVGYLYVIIVFMLRDAGFDPYHSLRPESKWRW